MSLFDFNIKDVPVIGGQLYSGAQVAFSVLEEITDDWRVRISLPSSNIVASWLFNDMFGKSIVLLPLITAGGLVFPYTPSIDIQHSASYDDVPVTHQNYQFLAYQHSKAEQITITGDFHVEDETQAQYWIAALHFLRAATKMYTGDTSNQGSPPPILKLNGYGDYVFKNVPVVIKSFTLSLPKDVDYISTTPKGGLRSGLDTIGGIAGTVSTVVDGLSNIGNLGLDSLGGLASGILATGESHVPTKSTLTVVLQPIYSREAVRQFSLQKFVSGQYVSGLTGQGGYI